MTMQFQRLQTQKICICMILAILLSGICNGTAQGTVSLSCRNISSVSQNTMGRHVAVHKETEGHKSQSYRMARISLSEEDYRLEETTAKLLNKVNSFRKENKRSISRRRFVYFQPAQYLTKGWELLQKQTIHKAKAIIHIHGIIIKYIHRKDGEKDTRL